jgi:hypothetical protein
MAQVTISEEHYRELAALATARGVSPDELADALLEESIIAADQHAFWGDDIEERLEESRREMESRPPRYLTDDEFLADLRARMKASTDADA